ncbi:MAG: L-threonylcarbamoyladenylate synthase [Candidatus Polarisedimenticolia bacterium]
MTARLVRFDPVLPDPRVLLRAAAMIRHGGLVAHPTETFYGLAADPFNAEAVARLGEVKEREASQACILIIPHTEAAHDLARIEGAAHIWFSRLTRAFWPGPLTLVLTARRGLRCPALGRGETVAVRLSPHPVAIRLVRAVGAPITSTSANRKGEAPPTRADALDPAVADRVDLIVDGGTTPGGLPSTLLDLSGERPVVVRAGAVEAEAIAAVLGFPPAPLLVLPGPGT